MWDIVVVIHRTAVGVPQVDGTTALGEVAIVQEVSALPLAASATTRGTAATPLAASAITREAVAIARGTRSRGASMLRHLLCFLFLNKCLLKLTVARMTAGAVGKPVRSW